MQHAMSGTVALAVFVGAISMSAPAKAYDMDCKVILCLAGGFPDGCSDAHSYMMRRLKKKQSPFGPCSGGSEAGGDYDVPVRMFSRKIQPICTAWRTDRDGQTCVSWIPGREEGVIGISIPQEGTTPDYQNDYIWWTRVWNPVDDQK